MLLELLLVTWLSILHISDGASDYNYSIKSLEFALGSWCNMVEPDKKKKTTSKCIYCNSNGNPREVSIRVTVAAFAGCLFLLSGSTVCYTNYPRQIQEI